MHYVYLIKSTASNKIYCGSTSDLTKRLFEHQNGLSLFTKGRGPWDLVYYEAYKNKALAMERERVLKGHGKSYYCLKQRAGLVSEGAG